VSVATIALLAIAVLVIIAVAQSAIVVPQKEAQIVERLGKYSKTLGAGFHVLVPFLDKRRYKHTLKEQVYAVTKQQCITKDNIAVEVDGVLYVQVLDPVKASYGIVNYGQAITQLAQTTMRSLIGKIELDRTFEERETINAGVVTAVDKASEAWGVKVTRYEIMSIEPPASIKGAMEMQMRAEREKRAAIATSEGKRQSDINVAEGDRQSRINVAEGIKQEAILRSEGEKLRLINEATGQAQQIELVAKATANGLREIATALKVEGGTEAMNLRIAQQYLDEFGKLAKTNNTMIIPSNLADIAGFVATLTKGIGAVGNRG
jgi:regulator of protease activity HflC (stomatin/prohibitin superfamily)